MNALGGPLVSVIMPAFNSARFIMQAIDSLRAQTYANWELIVVDDKSTDGTIEIIEREVKRDQRVRLICAETKLGAAGARNLAIREATGRFIAFLDSDDLWLPNKLQIQVNAMLAGGYAVTYGRYRRISENSLRVGHLLRVPEKISYQTLLCQNIVGTLTVMIDRTQIPTIEMRSERHEDFILWLELLKKGYSFYGIQQDLARYRVVNTSVSHNKLRAASWVWRIYRHIEGLNLVQSVWYFSNYFLRSSIRYSRF